MDRAISRRDFLNGVGIAIGSFEAVHAVVHGQHAEGTIMNMNEPERA
jgi:hypothetical protein